MNSVALGKPIALGRTAEVYAWQDHQVLKLYFDWCPPGWIETEAQVGRIVHAAGLPAPAVGEIVEVNERRGLVFERVEGISMLDILLAKPWRVRRLARQFAELHAAIHGCRASDLPSQREDLGNAIRATQVLPSEVKIAALRRLDGLSDGDVLCHGDLHPANVMLTAHGAVVIDWIAATRGNSIADVARTLLLLTIGDPPGTLARLLVTFLRRTFCGTYLKHYFELRRGERAEITTWQPVIAAARLTENIAGEQEILLARVRAGFDERSRGV